MSAEIFSTDPNDSPTSKWCVVFDTRTGDVVHIHQLIAFNSSDLLSAERLAEQALGQVSSRRVVGLGQGLPSSEVPAREYLEVAFPTEDIQPEGAQRLHVDLNTRRVVAEPLQ